MSPEECYRFGPFRLDSDERKLRRGDELIPLPSKAFDLLQLLLADSPRTIPKSELMAALWPDTVVEESNLTQTVFLLRKALGDDAGRALYIQTVPRLGYRLGVPVTHDSAVPFTGLAPAVASRTTKRWLMLAGIAAVMAIAFVAMSLGRARTPKAPTITPFSSEAGANLNPVWSPDGKAVAFGVRRGDSDDPQMHVRNLDSPSATQLTDRYRGSPVAWTAGRIVFHSSQAPAGLWTISPTGGDAEPLLPIAEAKARESAHVSSDGSVAAYYGPDKDGALSLMISSPAGAPAKPYTPFPFSIRTHLFVPKVKFSPNGKQILLLRYAGEGAEAWLMPYPADGSNPPHRIFANLPINGSQLWVSWMPDNRRIVLAMILGSAPRRLYMADTVSGEYSILPGGTTSPLMPAVSPDGKKLAFQEVAADRNLVSIDSAGAAVRPVVATNRNESYPAWAAKASAMVYATDRNGTEAIWLHTPGESDRPLVTGGDSSGFLSPVLSPDGSRLTYTRTERTGPSQMWMSAVAGGAPVRVVKPTPAPPGGDAKDDAILIPGSWSPDGAWIAFLKFQNGKSHLYKVQSTGLAEPVLLKADVKRSGSGSAPLWSPTGEWILSEDDGMKLISPDGKTTRELASGNIGACGFSRDGALVYCIRQGGRSETGVFFSVPVAGGPEKVIGTVAPENKPFWGSLGLRLSLAPDGRSFTYMINKTTANLWMMDGLE